MIHELGHNLIDQNTNLGELRQLIHLKVVALALLVGFLLSLPTTLGIRRLASRSLEKMQCYLLTLENLDWESFLLDETFAELLVEHYMEENNYDPNDIEKNRSCFLSTKGYRHCEEALELSSPLLEKFGIKFIATIFRFAANLDIDPLWRHREMELRYRQMPMRAEDSPDTRLLLVLRYCNENVYDLEDPEFSVRLSNYLDRLGIHSARSLVDKRYFYRYERAFWKEALKDVPANIRRKLEKLPPSRYWTLDGLSKYWEDMARHLILKQRHWTDTLDALQWWNANELAVYLEETPSGKFVIKDEKDTDYNVAKWLGENLVITIHFNRALLGAFGGCLKKDITNVSCPGPEKEQDCTHCHLGAVLSRVLPQVYRTLRFTSWN